MAAFYLAADPKVSNALPWMQWALGGAKRLECGSLLPLCSYAQTTCLERYRHYAEDNVSVPISASEWSLPTLRQPPIRTRGNLRATPHSGGKTQTTSLSLYPTQSQRACRGDRLTGGRESGDRQIDQTRGLKIFADLKDSSI